MPGKTNTVGISAGVFGTQRPLSLDDSEALRTISGVRGVVPVVQGNAQADAGRRGRRTEILGVGADAFRVWNVEVTTGPGPPRDDIRAARPLAIVGPNLGRELFGNSSPLGQIARVAGTRFRVIGVLEARGQILGFDPDNAIYIPAARALELFKRESLMEIDLLYSHEGSADRVSKFMKRVLTRRHGREDFTIISQDQML
jgi:putative ABC transport system permease protein